MRYRVSPSGPYTDIPLAGNLEVANLAALGALPADGDVPDWVWVISLSCYWHRNAASVVPADGITCIAAIGGGRWERNTETTSPRWCSQGFWYVDFEGTHGGNDENVGDLPSTPLRTTDELNRRLSNHALTREVWVFFWPTAVIPSVHLEVETAGFLLRIRGTELQVVEDDVDVYTAYSHVTPAPTLIQPVTIADWTPYVNHKCRVTNGFASGAIFWPLAAGPGGVAVNIAATSIPSLPPTFVSGWIPPKQALAHLNHFQVYTQTTIQNLSLTQRRNRTPVDGASAVAFWVQDMVIGNGSDSRLTIDLAPGFLAIVDGCEIQAGEIHACGGEVNITRSLLGPDDQTPTAVKGRVAAQSCPLRAPLSVASPELVLVRQSTSYGVSSTNGAFCQDLADTLEIQLALIDSQIWDATNLAGTGRAISFEAAGTIWTHTGLSGGRNDYGLFVGLIGGYALGGQQFAWSAAADLPNLAATVAEVNIASAGPTNFALPWSELIEPFNSNEQNGSATLVAGTVTVGGGAPPAHNPRFPTIFHVQTQRLTGGGVPRGELVVTAEAADSFTVEAQDPATGLLVATDTGSFRWHIPAWGRPLWIGQASGLQLPN